MCTKSHFEVNCNTAKRKARIMPSLLAFQVLNTLLALNHTCLVIILLQFETRSSNSCSEPRNSQRIFKGMPTRLSNVTCSEKFVWTNRQNAFLDFVWFRAPPFAWHRTACLWVVVAARKHPGRGCRVQLHTWSGSIELNHIICWIGRLRIRWCWKFPRNSHSRHSRLLISAVQLQLFPPHTSHDDTAPKLVRNPANQHALQSLRFMSF